MSLLIENGASQVIESPTRGTEFIVVPPKPERWQPHDPTIQFPYEVAPISEIPVFFTYNVPSSPQLVRFHKGELAYDDTLPSHRSANNKPIVLEPLKFVKIYEQEKDGTIGPYNLTAPISVQGHISLMGVPSVAMCADHIPTRISELDPYSRSHFFTRVGSGIREYMRTHHDKKQVSVSVTDGEWKSIGKDGVVHTQITVRDEKEMASAQITPLHFLDSDLPGLYANNEAGIYTACALREVLNLKRLFGIPIERSTVYSSGSLEFEIPLEVGTLVESRGGELFPYLEEMMRETWAFTAGYMSDTRDREAYQYFLDHYCGAISLCQTRGENTKLQVVTGLNMNPYNPARGGIFAAQNIWVERRGLAPLDEALAFHERTSEFARYLQD